MFLSRDSNPYAQYLESFPEVSTGKKSTLSESFAGGYQESQFLMSSYGDSALYSNLYKENLKTIENITGEKLNSFELEYGAFKDVIGDMNGEKRNYSLQKSYPLLVEQNKRIEELKKQYPQIKSPRELLDDTKALAKQMDTDSAVTYDRAGSMGAVSYFAGGVAGSFNLENPLNVLSVGFGMAGSITRKIIGETAINSAVEAVNQLTGVTSTRRNLGLEQMTTEQKLTQIAMAGVGAGAITGAGYLAPKAISPITKGYKAIEGKLFPEKSILEKLDDDLNTDKSIKQVINLIDSHFYMSERNKAIAIQALDADSILVKNNPYDKSVDGIKQFENDVNDFILNYETGMTKAELLGTSSRVKFGNDISPEAMIDIETNPYVPKAKAESPEIFKALDEQQAKIDDMSKSIEAIEANIKGRVVADTVSLSDPILGDRIRAVNDALNANPTKKQKVALEKERDMLVESLDVNSLSKVESDFSIGQKREVRSMRKSLDAEKRKLRDIKKQAYKAIDNVVKRDKLKAITKPTKKTVGKSAPLQKSETSLNDMGKMELSAIKSQFKKTDTPDTKAKNPDKLTLPKEGKVVIGGREIDLDADMPFESFKSGDTTEVRTMKVRDILKDMDDDDALIKAMEVCSL